MAESILKNPLQVTKRQVVGSTITFSSMGNVCVVSINGGITANTGTQTTIGTLNQDERPSATVYGICAVQSGSTGKFAFVAINNLGAIVVYNYSGTDATYLYGSVMFIK